MTEREALGRAISVLDDLGIPHALTGSFAISYHGRPRTSHGADLVVAVRPGQVGALCRALQAGFYVSPEAAREAVERRTMFTVVHLQTTLRVHFWIAAAPFGENCLERRWPAADLLPGAHVVSPEDAILSKLVWFREGESERHMEDAGSVVDLQRDALDCDYLRLWAPRLGVTAELERLLEDAA